MKTVKDEKNPLGFWCKNCKEVHHATEWTFGEVGDYNETHLTCPKCKKKLILRQKSVMATIREQLKYERKHRK